MIGGLAHIFDNLLGRGEAAVTVPPLDGAFRPNRLLDEAEQRIPLTGIDCLAWLDGKLVASAGQETMVLTRGRWARRTSYGSTVNCIAPAGEGGLAVALSDGSITIEGGEFDGRRYGTASGLSCITAVAMHGGALYVANGSATVAAEDWQRDLLERNASGSIWRIDLGTGSASLLADGLAWPAGLVADEGGLVFAEAWRHRLVRLDAERPERRDVLHADLPAYPGRISKATDGYWLALFAPRSQLVEFVLREPAYRKRMMAEVPAQYWVSPKLRAGRSFYESLQGGGVKHLGLLKPWAPAMSAGLCVRLDRAFQPRASLQSRADGATHGVTSAVDDGETLYVAARGDGVLVALAAGRGGDS